MDIYEPIRQWLYAAVRNTEVQEKLEDKCGIISSSYPPTELYPDGYTIKYPFPIKPKDAERYVSYDR